MVATKEYSSRYLDIDEISLERKNYNDTEKYELEDGSFLNYTKIADKPEVFLRAFKKLDDKAGTDYHYFDLINDMMANSRITLPIDFQDILDAKGTVLEYQDLDGKNSVEGDLIYDIIDKNPKLFLKSIRKAAFKILSEQHYDYALEIKEHFRVVIANAIPFKKEVTEINHSDIGKLVYTENFIVSISSQKNYTKSMAWSCGICGKLTYRESVGYKLPRLRKCSYCDSEDISESNKDAITETMMEVKLQQKYERISSGRVPKSIMGVLTGKDMMDKARAGDICGVTGIVNLQRNPNAYENAIADYYIDIEWLESKPDDFLIEDDPELEERVKNFIDPKNEDVGYQNLIESIAPSVMGHEIIKEALLLQLVGSDVGFFSDNSRHRGEINILLCGDAGTAKTKLAYYVYQLYARAVYVSSKTTEAGITASVNIATKTGHAVLEAGAYLLASTENGGIVILDEAEKTDSKARFATAACMDDKQVLEIHKFTIHQNIQLNCASLHISNPKTGEAWNTELTIRENTGFENWYLSRFCPWIVRDEVDKDLDTKKASHFMKQFGNTVRHYKLKDRSLNEIRRKQSLTYLDNKNIKSVPEMRMFNKVVRKNFHPAIDPNSKAAQKLERYYISIRPQGAHAKSLRITMRSLGDLIRFAEASARAHMRNEVTEKDADIAIKLVSSSIASSGFNVLTGEYEEQLLAKDKNKKSLKNSQLENIKPGIYTAADLLRNKKGAAMAEELDIIARKRSNRFFRDVALKMKKMIRVVKAYGLVRCRDCRGEGAVNDGHFQNTCYNCQGMGGQISSFDLNDVTTVLLQYGLQKNDILELVQGLLKKQIITQNFKSKNSYRVIGEDYRKALINLAAVEANVEAVYGDEPIVNNNNNNNNNPINPELAEKIKNMENKMPESLRKKVNKELKSLDDEDEDDDEDDEEEDEK